MRFVFRVDASPQIGVGHVMRCLAIAESAKVRGVNCIFVSDLGQIVWLEEKLKSRGLEISSPEELIRQSFNFSDVLILDSYEIDPNDKFIKATWWCYRVAIVDEYSPKYSADLYIHPGLDDAWSQYPPDIFRYGNKLIPIRDELKNLAYEKESNFEIDFMIIGGGTDTFLLGEEMVKFFSSKTGYQNVTVISDTLDSIDVKDSRIHLMRPGNALKDALAQASFVITTASTLSLELVALGIPIGVVCATANQTANFNYLISNNLAFNVGYRLINGEWKIDGQLIEDLIRQKNLRIELLNNSQGQIGLDGANEIVDLILVGANEQLKVE